MGVIELNNLQKTIGQNPVIDVKALTVEAGEIAAIVGPEGSGRDALLELLIGRTQPTMGTVRVARVDPRDKAQLSRRAGVLFAADGLYETRSPLANLTFHTQLFGLQKSRAVEVLARVGLADQAGAKLSNLSPGLLRRLAFGRAILHRPEVLLLEDPFSRCDESSIALLSTLIRELAEDGAAVLILADDEANLTALCDTVYVLSQGQIVESYRPLEERRAAQPFKVPAKLEDKVVLVNPGDVLYAVAEESRAFLQTVDGRLPTQFTLAELEQRLVRSGFFRAHRGYLVNLQHVKEVIPYTRNSYSLRLDDDDRTEIPLSKSAARELRELLGY
jgi:ABC-2 type transport system ATP-binding protein